MTDTNIIPEIGVFRDVPAAVYHRWEAASASRLNVIRQRSPKHMRWEADHPSPPTPAKAIGSAAHTLILQPDLFRSEFITAEPCRVPLKSGDRKGQPCGASGKNVVGGQWVCGRHGGEESETGIIDGRQLISASDVAICEAMRDAVLTHPYARGYLGDREDTEISIVWIDEDTGVLCKARMDAPCWSARVICDLKTTERAGKEDFARSIAKFGYDLQDEQYIAASVAGENLDPLGKVKACDSFAPIVVEKRPPHDVGMYRIENVSTRNSETRNLIREHRRNLLTTYGQCAKSGKWPGVCPGILDIEVPTWEKMKLETAILNAAEEAA